MVVWGARWLGHSAARGDGSGMPIAIPVLVFGAALLVAFRVLMRRVAEPVGEIVAAADSIAARNFTVRVPEQGPESVRSVARAFNTMASRLESQEQARRHLMSDIAHELRTPLAVLQGRIEGLIDGIYSRDEARLGELLEETRVLTRLVDDLQTLAESESGTLVLRKEPTEIATIARDAVAALSARADEKRVRLEVISPTELPMVNADPVRIREVLTNLLTNALRHTPRGGSIAVRLEAGGAAISISVTDSGSGIPANELPKIFDRFYKGRESSGSGLGLTIARDLVTAHGGSIHAESVAGQGTTISFTIPA
jgi:two-component system OmpR family sensor kinase/two-component system sensor histidine kinase BaeS